LESLTQVSSISSTVSDGWGSSVGDSEGSGADESWGSGVGGNWGSGIGGNWGSTDNLLITISWGSGVGNWGSTDNLLVTISGLSNDLLVDDWLSNTDNWLSDADYGLSNSDGLGDTVGWGGISDSWSVSWGNGNSGIQESGVGGRDGKSQNDNGEGVHVERFGDLWESKLKKLLDHKM